MNESPPVNESRTVQLIVVFLGAIALLGVAATAWLIHTGAEASEITPLVGLVGPPIGALAALLASTNSVNARQVAEQARTEQAAGLAELAARSGPA